MSRPVRRAEFARSENYDRMLREMNEWYRNVEDRLTSSLDRPGRPVVFIVGAPRSGTTLMTQLLAATGAFAYPSNLLARFYANVFVGARVQRMLAPLLPEPAFSFSSTLGRTTGWYEPNEFGFFWNLYFPFGDHHDKTDEELSSGDTARFLSQLSAMETAFDGPVCMKGMHFVYNALFLRKLVGDVLFVRLTRDPAPAAQSLLSCRKRFFGDERAWWSLRPRNWRKLSRLKDPLEQVAAQLASVDRALDLAVEAMPCDSIISFPYTSLCEDPHSCVHSIAEALKRKGCPLSIDYSFPASFSVSERENGKDPQSERIRQLWRHYYSTSTPACAIRNDGREGAEEHSPRSPARAGEDGKPCLK